MLASTLNLVNKELRGWRHRLWWLPLAGAIFVIVPMAWSQPPQLPTPDELQQRPWMMRQVILSTIPAQPFAILVGLLAGGSLLLASWLARAARCQEIHDDTLTGLALTPVRGVEMIAAQMISTTLVTTMMLVGAMPVLVYYATIAGRSTTDLALGLGTLVAVSIMGAVLGQTTMWWKRLALTSVRGRSYAGFVTCVSVMMMVLGTALVCPIVWPVIRSRTAKVDLDTYFMLAAISFVWGLPALCLIHLWLMALHDAACSLRRGLRGFSVSAALIAFVLITAPLAMRCVNNIQSWASSGSARLPAIPELFLVPFYPGLIAPLLLGGQVISTEFTAAMSPALYDGIMLGFGYWVLVGLYSFVFAARDLNWTLTNAWSIACLQNPARAALQAQEAEQKSKRRAWFYPFVTRNPMYDLCLARSTGTRTLLFSLLGLATMISSAFIWLSHPGYRREPLTGSAMEASVTFPIVVGFFLCACCGMSCGLTIARLKRTQQWPALLVTPLGFRSLLFGACAPRGLDAMVLMLLCGSSQVLPWTLRLIQINAEDFVGFFLFMALVVYGAAMASLFASAMTKSPDRTLLLGVVVVVLSFVAFGFLLTSIENRFFPRGPDRTKWQEHGATVISTSLLLVGVSALAWLGSRRLRWDR